MIIIDSLPDRISVGRRTYRLHTDFKRVLEAIAVLSRDDLFDDVKIDIACSLLVKGRPKDKVAAVNAVFRLFSDAKSKDTDEKVFSIEQDDELVYAAFRQVYGIDLRQAKLHWLEFKALLNGLPEDTQLSRVIALRGKKVPAPTKYNAEERQALIKAKQHFAIRQTDKERTESLEKNKNDIFAVLKNMAKQ